MPKKFILPVFILLAIFVIARPVWAAELWKSNGYEFEMRRNGNKIMLLGTTTASRPRYVGVPVLTGTISGTTFNGTKRLFADECPDIDKDVPASGTVSSDGRSITVTFLNEKFDPSTCTWAPGTKEEESKTYAKIDPTSNPAISQAKQVIFNNQNTASASANSDRYEALLESQKLSYLKIGIAGLVLAVIIGGVFWFARRKKRR